MGSEQVSANKIKKLDRAGTVLSALCGLHCVATPFMTLSLPFWIYSIHYSPVHLFLAVFIFPIAIYSFWTGYKRHGNKLVVVLGSIGLTLLGIALTEPVSRNQLRWNDIMTIIGSVFLIAGHYLNRRSLQNKPDVCFHENI